MLGWPDHTLRVESLGQIRRALRCLFDQIEIGCEIPEERTQQKRQHKILLFHDGHCWVANYRQTCQVCLVYKRWACGGSLRSRSWHPRRSPQVLKTYCCSVNSELLSYRRDFTLQRVCTSGSIFFSNETYPEEVQIEKTFLLWRLLYPDMLPASILSWNPRRSSGFFLEYPRLRFSYIWFQSIYPCWWLENQRWVDNPSIRRQCRSTTPWRSSWRASSPSWWRCSLVPGTVSIILKRVS